MNNIFSKKEIRKLIFVFFIFLILIIGATYAYFVAQGGETDIGNVEVITHTSDSLIFQTGDPIIITASQQDFYERNGNKSSTTFAKASLKANTQTKEASVVYNLYLDITNNEFVYTSNDASEIPRPEILLKITDKSGNEIINTYDNSGVLEENISGLIYKSVVDGEGNTQSGFDVTSSFGLVTLLYKKEITATGDIESVDEWNVEVIFINLNSDQELNTGKSFEANLIIQKEEYEKKTLADVCSNGDNLAACIKNLGDTYAYDKSDIVKHDGSNIYDANDNSYRYAGNRDDGDSCKYNGNVVEVFEGNITESKCDNVWYFSTTGRYFGLDNEFSDPLNVVWDNGVCKTVNGDSVTYIGLPITSEENCTGIAYSYSILNGNYIIGVTSLGEGKFEKSSKFVNNYVCFGGTCDDSGKSENLYRIIGVFGDQVKLIKATVASPELLGGYDTDGTTMLGTYCGSNNYRRDSYLWASSVLNLANLNSGYVPGGNLIVDYGFLANIGSSWRDMIADHNWIVGGNIQSNILATIGARNVYDQEINKSAQFGSYVDENVEYQNKIGLMYVSDYMFASNPTTNSWATLKGVDNSNVKNDFRIIKNNNWLASDLTSTEWTITHDSSTNNKTFAIIFSGWFDSISNTHIGVAVRPTFYLNSNVTYRGGTGSVYDPIILM